VAMIAGYGLLAVGVACVAVAGAISDTAALPWRSVAVAAALAVSVVLYDAILKRTPLGPLAMGACRMLNVLLGMSLASANIRLGEPLVIGYSAAQLMAAGGIGVYITGVTWFARTEAQESNRLHLLGGTLTLLGGIALAAAFPTQLPALEGRPLLLAIGSVERWWLLMLLIAGLIGWRCVDAVTDPQPRKVQYAVKYCIWSLIVLDAVLATAVCGPVWGLVILALLLPTMTLGRFVYST